MTELDKEAFDKAVEAVEQLDYEHGKTSSADYYEAVIKAYLEHTADNEGWQTMDSAPKDGTHIFLWDGGKRVIGWFGQDWYHNPNGAGEWLFGTGDDFSTGYYFNPIEPTHWQPLPQPPKPTSNDKETG